MDWFERLTGFREIGYEDTRRRREVIGSRLRSLVNGRSFGIGELELVSLQALRERAGSAGRPSGRMKVRIVSGDVRAMHQESQYTGALFQVASQFNLLEMISPDVTPEQGVTRYEHDRTQGPACAIAAGAATLYRNYLVPIGNGVGQTAQRQFDGLAELGSSLGKALGTSVESLWTMRNGYAICSRAGLDAIARLLGSSRSDQVDALRATLRIGIHRDVEVTDAASTPGPTVSQAFCSALPVAYSQVHAVHWRSFATLVLEAAYEATMWAAVENAKRGGSNIVLLTRLGGGAFGNDDEWIHAAMTRALRAAKGFDIDVRLVSYGVPSVALTRMADEFG